MEKYFIVTNEDYLRNIERDEEIRKSRNAFIKKFFSENEIDGTGYYFGGNGFCNESFEKKDESSISLHIENTEVNKERFGKQFKKSRFDGMVSFRKRSELLKKFQKACIESEVIINQYETRVGDYFKELSLGGYRRQQFCLDNKLYLNVDTNAYNNSDITPKYDGFNEIKASEYHIALEKLKAENQEN